MEVRTHNNSFIVNCPVSLMFTRPSMIDWLTEHCVGDLEIRVDPNKSDNQIMLFENSEDAVLFSLRWLGTAND